MKNLHTRVIDDIIFISISFVNVFKLLNRKFDWSCENIIIVLFIYIGTNVSLYEKCYILFIFKVFFNNHCSTGNFSQILKPYFLCSAVDTVPLCALAKRIATY